MRRCKHGAVRAEAMWTGGRREQAEERRTVVFLITVPSFSAWVPSPPEWSARA